MAEESSAQEKTEDPTARRISEARKRGQVARSQELSSVAIITAGLITLLILGPATLQQMLGIFTTNFSEVGKMPINMININYLFQSWGWVFVKILAPIMLILALVGFFISFAQVGPLFSFKAMEPQPDRFNLAKGAKRLFALKSLFNLFRDSIKIILIAAVAYYTLKAEMPNYLPLMDKDVGQIFLFGAGLTFKLGIRCALALLLLAILDYAYQKWNYKKGLKMSKQDVKDEMKTYEGNPQIKARARRVQQEQARKRMFQDIPNADVVVTNPTEIAVALKYKSEEMNAPKIIAKGQRLIAEKIKEIAREYDIPIVEDKPLARSLFQYVEVGMEVPEHLYKAVAEVLAYVHKLKNNVK